MSRHLDLRTGRPVWTAYRAPRVPTKPLKRDARCDVLVVGMGVSGAMIAEALTDAGHDVMAIDRRGPLLGSTSATTALVQFELDVPLTKLVRTIGREAAEAVWRRSRLAVSNLMGRIEALDIDCRLHTRRSLYLAGDVLDPDGLQAEGVARREAGIDARFLDARGVLDAYGIRRDAALESSGNLALDPRRLTAGLLLTAARRGARLHAPAEATAFDHSASGVEVATLGGPVIRAGHVVLATGYELADPVPAEGHQVISTWALATRPQPRHIWPHAAFMWEASDPYLYLRATHDGRVICGGEDEEFSDEERRDALIPEKIAAIVAKLAKLLPGIDPTPEFAWAGAFGSTQTGMPIIRRLPRKPRMHAVMGYGGNGITFSRLAAEIVRTEIDGGQDSDAALFAGAKD